MNQSNNVPSKWIAVGAIGTVVLAVIGILQFLNIDPNSCEIQKKELKSVEFDINEQITVNVDQRKKINLLYYKEKIGDILNYDCATLQYEEENINSVIRDAKKILQ